MRKIICRALRAVFLMRVRPARHSNTTVELLSVPAAGGNSTVLLNLPPTFAEAHPDAAQEVAGWARAKDARLLADELEAFAGSPDLTPALSSLDIPILARVGELDVSTPIALSEVIVGAARRGRLEVVPRVGHALLLEDLTGTVKAVRRALA